jgi:hypothetical protein
VPPTPSWPTMPLVSANSFSSAPPQAAYFPV